jgi:hypothetical protein
LTGKKRDFTSLPFSKLQAFSSETPAGTSDLPVRAGRPFNSTEVAATMGLGLRPS